MLLRVRSNVGVWRVQVPDTATPQEVLNEIAQTRPHVVYETPLCHDPACTSSPLENHISCLSQGLTHGSMIYCRVDPSTCANIAVSAATTGTPAAHQDNGNEAAATSSSSYNTGMKRVIDKDGSIKLVPSTEAPSTVDKGFRKGMMALRDMKMAWTLNEFVAMNSQFEFKMQRQEKAICDQVSLDVASVSNFQAYCQQFQFQRKRFGILYGTFITNEQGEKKTKVEAIYEPPQQPDPEAAEGFEQLEDPMEDTVEKIAQMCGLKKVGWILGHGPREPGMVLEAAEIIMAAELQLEAAGGVEETPFVTVQVSPKEDGNVAVEAFQVSQQCMAMVAEEALEVGPNPKECVVNETFTAIQEGKESKTVENNFFLTVVPIVQHTSETFVAQFPRMNRDLDDRTPSKDELKRQLSKSGTQGWTFIDLLSDFNLLIYLSNFLDINADFPKICQSVVDRDITLEDGYKIIIASVAGLDQAY